ncbi:unnamed protein product [Fraxinus pennsylvanica]|uniref:MACPF domain-containing protein n=1 Tax=Fraxinus pennsylvanica TaxID=56036 RepID=A0AAD1YZM6_9LAMI|nr:unnamed protein product [Fraxinus pennsylvanica]
MEDSRSGKDIQCSWTVSLILGSISNLSCGGDEMEENAAALHTAMNSVQALGSGFDVNYDTKLLYCKGVAGSRIVEIDEEHIRDLYLADDLVVPNVSRDIKNSQEARGRDGFGVCSYNEMVEYFNKKANISGNVPLGSFNSAFSFTGSKHLDASATKRRGGDDLEQSHTQWVRTVQSSPDVIEMSFFPITELLEGVRGKEHLACAIGLYLEYKPQIEELRYFLEYQVPRIWSPVQDRFPGQPRKEPVCPSLQFSMMGQKLYVSQEQVSVGRKPVTGMRLCLEGIKQNRLSIHLQHLVFLPKILQPYWDTHIAIGAPKWQGSEEQDSRWFEPVKWKKFSHVSTAPIENSETFIDSALSGVYIVTGAQLGVWDFGSRNVLHMKLLYSRLPGCTIRRSLWDHVSNDKSRKQFSSGSNSDDLSSSSGENSVSNKLAKFVNMSEMSKGPQDTPGHCIRRDEATLRLGLRLQL